MSSTVANGLLSFDVHDEFGKPIGEPLQLLLSENVARLGRQYRVSAKPGVDDIGGSFPAGSYNAQIFARGYEVVREAIQLGTGHALRRKLQLKKRSFARPGPVQRLAAYGLAPDGLSSLTVRAGERAVLDYRSWRNTRHFTVLRPQSARDLKAWIGTPDAGFAGDTARFGPVQRGAGQDLEAIAREFIHGNSRAVQDFEAAIDEQLRARALLILVPVFHFDDVVVEDGGVLEIGTGSSVFFCNTLTMHAQGVVRAAGDVRADIGTCIQL
jgi:hypothetical protein